MCVWMHCGLGILYQWSNKINNYRSAMQVFRKKYLYNPENPIYESANVQTYNCMNTDTKDNKLIILRHLGEPPFVDPTPGVLQPIEAPTMSEPFSVYPLVYCCSEIGKINEADAMYVLKCLIESKMKNPLYCVMSPQGVCTSDVEGLLPNRSPSLFQIAIELLGVPATLVDEADSVVSREALQVCKGIRDGENIIGLVNNYGWANPKKEKDVVKDDQFWVFKGRRKDEGPFGQEYGLAWLSKVGLARFKYIDLSKDGYEEEFYQDFSRKMQFYQKNEDKEVNTVSVFKFVKEGKGIRIFTEVLNQGTVSEYIQRRKQLGKALTQATALPLLQDFVNSMKRLLQVEGIGAHGSLHSRNLYIHDHRIVIGQPILVTDKIEKKLRELKTTFDYYAPEMKENIILPENLMKLSFEKMDVWSFGFLAHKLITRDLPAFDATRNPVLAKGLLSPGMFNIITKCLSVSPANRPSWLQIDLKDLAKAVVVEEVVQESQSKSVVRLGTSKELSKKQKKQKSQRYEAIQEDEVIDLSEKPAKVEQAKVEEQVLKSEEEEKFISPIPVELSLRLKRIKLIAKIIIVMVLYLAVFFRDFIAGSLGILLVRNFYGTTSLNLVDNSNNIISTTVVITHQPNFFLLNDISFSDIQNVYNCINNQFDPIYNPNYSLLTYVQSNSFLALLLSGWGACLLICITKAISIWKGGISNRPNKGVFKYFVIYGFHELSIAALLFSHFFIFQFFYFASGTPCFSIKSFTGISPFFDSSLYLFLMHSDGYLSSIFASLGVLAILVFISTCYYAWGPKLDQKYFLSIPSILFRLIPYVLLILICRIGVFLIFAPSAMNDSSEMLPAIIKGSADGFFGIIPQMFVTICVIAELLLQLFFYWCERKAAESDKLAGLFNIHRKKLIGDRVIQDSHAHLNDMSIAKSQMKINDEQLFG